MSAKLRLTKDELEAWRVHPVTEIVHRYLRDYAAIIRDDWRDGVSWTDEARWEVECYEAIAETDYETIETFYEEQDEQDSQGNAVSD